MGYWTDEGRRGGQVPDGWVPEERVVDVTALWVVDRPAVREERVVAVYPDTGGRDVETVEVEPEAGHWSVLWPDGSEVEHYDGPLPDESWRGPDGLAVRWAMAVWRPPTEEELEARRAEELERLETPTNLELGAALEEVAAMAAEQQGATDDVMAALAELAALVAEMKGAING